MMKTLMRLAGGATVLAIIALLARGAARPALADPAQIVMFNPSICAAVGGEPFLAGCAVNEHGLEVDAGGGDGQLLEAANRVGNNNNVIEPSDFAGVAEFTGGQIHQQGAAVTPTFSRLAIVAFVNGHSQVTFHTTAGTFDESGSATYVCDGTGSPLGSNKDPDCGSTLSPNIDHVVVAYLSCTLATCPTLGTASLTVEQDSIVFPVNFTVVGDARSVTFFTLEKGIQAGVPVSGALSIDSAKVACPFSASLPFITKALGEAEKTVIVARALDINGTAISGAWFQWSVDDPNHNTGIYFDSQGILAQPVTPTLNLGGFGYGAPNILCAPSGAVAGDVIVTARLIRNFGGQNFDPKADPGTDSFNLTSTALAYGNQPFTVNAIPAKVTLTASPATVACDGTATSTVSAQLADAAGNPSIDGTAVHFDAQVLGTANPIDAKTDGKGVATSVISPLAGDVRGVPVTVSVQVGGVLQPNLTQSIMLSCTGAAPTGGAPGGGAAPPPAGGGAGAGGTGTIAPPNTGTGPAADAGSAPGVAWAFAALALAAGVMAAASKMVVSRRRA